VDYIYDVFLSYRRSDHWSRYVSKHFLPVFTHWLNDELNHRPQIYYDVESVETGTAWPDSLAEGLAHSKVMVCLWTGQYWASQWCKKELCHMLARRRLVAGGRNAPRLILPVVLTDCDNLHPSLSEIQAFSLKGRCNNPWMTSKSRSKELLGRRLEKFAGAVAGALQQVPDWDPAWPYLSISEFEGPFTPQTVQKLPPTLG